MIFTLVHGPVVAFANCHALFDWVRRGPRRILGVALFRDDTIVTDLTDRGKSFYGSERVPRVFFSRDNRFVFVSYPDSSGNFVLCDTGNGDCVNRLRLGLDEMYRAVVPNNPDKGWNIAWAEIQIANPELKGEKILDGIR